MNTVVYPFSFKCEQRGRIRMKPRPKGESCGKEAILGSVPRVTKLMALAIKFEGLVQSGAVKDYAELARLGHVTRARMSQIMSLSQTLSEAEGLTWPPTSRRRSSFSRAPPRAATPSRHGRCCGSRRRWIGAGRG